MTNPIDARKQSAFFRPWRDLLFPCIETPALKRWAIANERGTLRAAIRRRPALARKSGLRRSAAKKGLKGRKGRPTLRFAFREES